ncbi:MAG: ribonuclease P protein component [Rhodospirillales bacterium]
MASAVPRLKRRSEFLRIARQGRKWAAAGLVLQVGRGGGEDGTSEATPPIRVGFTASRKVGNAVARNRVRRRLRAVAEEILPMHAKPGYDYVIVGRVATVRRSYAALLADLMIALERLGVRRAPAAGDAPVHDRGTAP